MESLTLEQAYYIGELGAAIVVALSIIFLIFEVRQNSKSIKLASAHDTTSRYTNFLELLINDNEILDVWVRGLRGFDSLNDPEQARFILLISSCLQTFDELYFQRREGVLEPRMWEGMSARYIDAFAYPGFQTVWEIRKHQTSLEFRSYVKQEVMASISKRKPLYPERD